MENIFSTLIIENNPKYIDKLEKEFNTKLPTLFKTFVQTFKYGEFNPKPEHIIIHTNEEICFDEFGDNLKKVFKIYQGQDEIYTKPKLFPIAYSCYHHGICLGIGEDNSDNIYLYKGYEDFELIANNIFEFVSQLKEINWNSI